jgi:hypothetical protein
MVLYEIVNRKHIFVFFVLMCLYLLAAPGITYALPDKIHWPDSWERIGWQYPVRDDSFFYTSGGQYNVVPMEEEPEIRIAGGEYESIVLVVDREFDGMIGEELILDLRSLPARIDVTIGSLDPRGEHFWRSLRARRQATSVDGVFSYQLSDVFDTSPGDLCFFLIEFSLTPRHGLYGSYPIRLHLRRSNRIDSAPILRVSPYPFDLDVHYGTLEELQPRTLAFFIDRDRLEYETLRDLASDTDTHSLNREELGSRIESQLVPKGDSVDGFHMMSRPAMYAGTMIEPAFGQGAPTPVGNRFVPGYRHLLTTLLDIDDERKRGAVPGRWQLYAEIGSMITVQQSDGENGNPGFYGKSGWTVSPESSHRLRRQWLIPFLGFELGGIYLDGTGFSSGVVAGLHVWSGPGVSISLTGGYTFTTVQELPRFFQLGTAIDITLGRAHR